MNIKRAKQEIRDAVEAYFLKDAYGAYEIPVIRQRPILILGAPGIGKTQIMEQIARECGIGLVSYTITHHTRQSAIGLPFISQKEFGGITRPVTEYTMSEIVASVYEKMEKTGLREGILFIDEINCVSETLAPAMLQFLQCKTFGSHQIPEGWLIVAAGNPPEYNKSVREFDVVTMDRVKKIEVEPDFGVWKEYAVEAQIHPAVLSYLNLKPKHFYKMENTVDGRSFATPRGWEDLSRLTEVYEKLGKTVDKAVVLQYLQHDKIAGDFANYLELYYKYKSDYQIEEVLRGSISEGLLKKLSHASFDECLSVVGLLIAGCTKTMREVGVQEEFTGKLFEKVKEAGRRLSEEQELSRKPWELLEEQMTEAEEERVRWKNAELLTREQERTLLRLKDTLESYGTELKKRGAFQEGEAFEVLKNLFGAEREAYERLQAEAGSRLEAAFDFLEAAFGNSQELVIFLTELNSSRAAVAFLQEYDCERYDRYNQQLLFRNVDGEILAQIEALS